VTDLISHYHPALVALAILCLAVLLQAVLTAVFAFSKGEQAPGMPLKGGPDLHSFRVLRTYGNSTENLPAFIGALILAIMVGVKPSLVNWVAGIHVGFRLLYWMVYYSKAGAKTPGPRTALYLGGWLTSIILVVAALLRLL